MSARDPSDLTPKLARAGARIAIFAALFIAVFAVLTMVLGDGRKVLQHIGQIGVAPFLFLLVLSLVNYVLRGVRWHLFSRRAGFPVTARQSLFYYFSGFPLVLTPSKVGELVRLWLLKRGNGVPYERSLGLLLTDRLCDGIAFALLIPAGLWRYDSHRLPIAAAIALVVIIALLLTKPAPILWGIDLAYRLSGRWPRLFARLRRALRHTATMMSPGTLLLAVALSLVGWMAEIYGFHLVLDWLGATVIGLADSAFVFAFASVVGALVVVPGGLGGVEGTMIGLLTLGTVDPNVAIAATIVTRAATLWFAIFLGFFFLIPAIRRVRRL